MKPLRTACALCAYALCAYALAACDSREFEELERYVADLEASSGRLFSAPECGAPLATKEQPARCGAVSASMNGLAPLSEFAAPVPSTYRAGGQRSPFEPPALGADPDAQLGAVRIAPDFSRPQQPLEAFPASALAMVGTIVKGAGRRGLVVDGDGGVHEVRAGDYLGEDHGRIQRIGEESIEFVEILPDGVGGWVERNRSLALAGAGR